MPNFSGLVIIFSPLSHMWQVGGQCASGNVPGVQPQPPCERSLQQNHISQRVNFSMKYSQYLCAEQWDAGLDASKNFNLRMTSTILHFTTPAAQHISHMILKKTCPIGSFISPGPSGSRCLLWVQIISTFYFSDC